jgi:hypothetical protein
MMKKLKDNPVPSLDEKQQFEIYKAGFIVVASGNAMGKTLIECFNEWFKQNGVETNKEQPECSNASGLCTCSLGYPCESAK